MQATDAVVHMQLLCTSPQSARATACRTLFDGSWRDMAQFFVLMLQRPMVFTQAQLRFFRELANNGAFQEESRASVDSFTVQFVGADYDRHGSLYYRIEPFIEALCRLFVTPPAQQANALDQLPCRVVAAAMFYTRDRTTFPLRAWFVGHFYAESCDDAHAWLESRNLFVLTPEMLDLAFHDTAAQQCDPRLMTARGPVQYRQAMDAQDYATFDTHHAVVQNVMDQSMPRKTVAFYSHFMQRMMLAQASASGSNALVAFEHNSLQAQRYWEICLAMLLAQPMDEFLPVICAVPPATLELLAQIAEEMRDFLLSPSNGGPPLVRSIYARTTLFDQVWTVNQTIREMLVRRSALERHLLDLFYVPVHETAMSALIDSLVDQQVVQLRLLNDWLAQQFDTRLCDLVSSSARLMPRESADRRFYVCRFPTNARLQRVRWTVEFWARTCPQLFHSLPQHTFTGLDRTNTAYMIMPRRSADAVRLVALCEALTLRNFRKMVAVYPLLMRLYLTSRGESVHEDVPGMQVTLDHLSLLTAVHVLGYWLCVPQVRNGDSQALYQREGMITIGGAIDSMAVLHRVVRVLYRGAIMREMPSALHAPHTYDVTRNMSLLNGVRSFLMITSPHHMSLKTVELLRRLLSAYKDEWRWLADALQALHTRSSGFGSGLATLRRPGRPRAKNDREQESRLSNSLLGDSGVEQLLHADNPLRTQDAAHRVHLFNVWLYDFVVHALQTQPLVQDEILRDFQAQTTALTADDYRRTKYICPTDFVQAWEASNQFFCDMQVTRYPSNNMQLREGYATDSDEFVWLLLLMQQLERFICLSDANRRASNIGRASSARRAPIELPQADAGLVTALTRMYADPERILATMPVASYFDRARESYQLAAFETAWCMADAVTPLCGGAPAHQDSDSTHLSHIGIDVVTAYGGMFAEDRVTQPDSRLCLLRQARQYEQSAGKHFVK